MLYIPLIDTVDKSTKIETISLSLNELPRNSINNTPWNQFPYKPDVSFAIAYSRDSILIKYFVAEEAIKVVYNQINEPVYKDSCVEFFISFDDTGYYNFEFNAIGNCLGGYGGEKETRTRLEEGILHQIKYFSTIHSTFSTKRYITWEISVMIPLDVFSYHQINSLNGRNCKVNFYKCGDDLPTPHYVCWNPIVFDVPNFHLPQFFGEAKFI